MNSTSNNQTSTSSNQSGTSSNQSGASSGTSGNQSGTSSNQSGASSGTSGNQNGHQTSNSSWAGRSIVILCIAIAATQIYFYCSHGMEKPAAILQILVSELSLFLAFAQAFPRNFQTSILKTIHINKRWETVSTFLCLLLALGAIGSDILIYGIPPNQGTSNQGTHQSTKVLRSTPSTPPPSSTPTPQNTTNTIADGQSEYEQFVNNQPVGWTNSGGDGTSGCAYVHSYIKDGVSFCPINKKIDTNNFVYRASMIVPKGGKGGIYFYSTIKNPTGTTSLMDRFSVQPSEGTYDILVNTDSSNGQFSANCASSAIHKTGKNTLTVIAKGQALYFYINGIYVSEKTDSTPNDGYIGVYAEDVTQSTDVAFSDAEVWQTS